MNHHTLPVITHLILPFPLLCCLPVEYLGLVAHFVFTMVFFKTSVETGSSLVALYLISGLSILRDENKEVPFPWGPPLETH